MNNPDFSIIVISRNSSKYLEILFRSLEAPRNSYDGKQELILVDDSTTEQERESTQQLCTTWNVRLLKAGPSVNVKRNLGAECAIYPNLLYLDSDCIASRDLLTEYAKAFSDEKVEACIGPVDFIGPASWLWRSVELSPYLFPFGFAKHHKTMPWGVSANFAVKRDKFLAIGGFNTKFPNRPGGEDVDLGLRLTKSGVVIHCLPDATVEHTRETWNTLEAMSRRLTQWGRAEYYLMTYHSDYLRQSFPRFSVLFCIILISCLVLAAISQAWVVLVMPLLWGLTFQVFNAIFTALRHAKGWHDFFPQLVTQYLLLRFELGMISECLRHGRPFLPVFTMIYAPGQIVGEWYYGAIRTWSFMIASLAIFLALLILVA